MDLSSGYFCTLLEVHTRILHSSWTELQTAQMRQFNGQIFFSYCGAKFVCPNFNGNLASSVQCVGCRLWTFDGLYVLKMSLSLIFIYFI